MAWTWPWQSYPKRAPRVATLINFCSNDLPFMRYAVAEAAKFSEIILVPVANQFFDGKPENEEKIALAQAQCPAAQFIRFPINLADAHPLIYWYGYARHVAIQHLPADIDYVMFLDADEIAEGDQFKAWLASGEPWRYKTLRLAAYWYFREVTFQAKTLEETPIMIARELLTEKPNVLLSHEDRNALWNHGQKPKKKMAMYHGTPLIHHYSWVRTKEQMLRKVSSSGHKDEKDWVKLVDAEFASPFSGKDFVHGYTYNTVPARWPININE